jgi:hypothetical protein
MRSSPANRTSHRRRGAGHGATRESGDSYLTEYAPPRISGELAELAADGITGDVANALERAISRVRASWDSGQDGSTQDEVRTRLAHLCKVLRHAYRGE